MIYICMYNTNNDDNNDNAMILYNIIYYTVIW